MSRSTRRPHPHSHSLVENRRPEGLTVHVGNGFERMVMSEQEICDDVLATIPKLRAAAYSDTYGRKWKAGRRKNGVDFFELVPGGCEDGEDDLDLAHAVVAKTELHCHLNEVFNVLIHRDTDTYVSTMRALCGRSFKDGRQLYKKRRSLQARQQSTANSITSSSSSSGGSCRASRSSDHPATMQSQSQPQTAVVAVNLTTLRPKLSVTSRRTQKLAFASCTVQYPTKDRAYHVMKTLPKKIHDELVARDDRTALRRELDHIAVGMDIRSTIGGYSSSSHTTRVFVHAYASAVPPDQYGRLADSRNKIAYSSADLGRHRDAIMNAEARTVMDTLTKLIRELETVIRRRRFGFQTFVYFPTLHDDAAASTKSCSICSKSFSFFRKDFFCQLCGHTVCGDCSRLYDVEAKIGDVRKNRCCIQCVVRVDACVFEDEDIVPALGPVVVPVDDAAWFQEPSFDDNDDTISIGSASSSVAGSLYSNDPTERSMALERLAQLISPTTDSSVAHHHNKPSSYKSQTQTQTHGLRTNNKNKNPQTVMRGLENHLAQSLRVNKDQYTQAELLPLAGTERDYVYEYDSSKVSNANVPLAPMPTPAKEARRLELIEASGVLSHDYDHAALDLLAQVAAKKMNCPIGFVSVIDETQFHCIGSYRLPVPAVPVPRDENLCMHNVYAEAPMILKNPQRDMRFAQMGFVGKMGVKFYAGFPIKAPDGSVVASLCTGDMKPHDNISTKDYATMEALSKLAADLIVPKGSAPVPGRAANAPSYEGAISASTKELGLPRSNSRPAMAAY